MKHIFIDTNIYLNFYHLSGDDIEELRKLLVAIDNRQLKLYITQQVKDEFLRNREGKIADALSIVDKYKLPSSYPRLIQGYDEYKAIRDAERDYSDNLKLLIEKVSTDIDFKSLAADTLINDLFEAATTLDINEDIISKAQTRHTLGNPPRKPKDQSLGDAINWETILANFNEEEPLNLVSQDGDYISAVSPNRLSEFLSNEWGEKKTVDIHFYRYLSVFFAQNFPDIKLADELDKELTVKRLLESGSYEETHICIGKLSKLADFTNEQVVDICNALIVNGQVSRIIEDEDVLEFYNDFVYQHSSAIPEEILDVLHELLGAYAVPPDSYFEMR